MMRHETPTNSAAASRSHIIVIVNPLPAVYLESLVRFLRERQEGRIRILVVYRRVILSSQLMARLQLLGVEVVQLCFTGRRSHFFALRHGAGLLKEWVHEAERVSFYHCQPNHLLTNFVTFATDRATHECHLIPDGMANHYFVATGPHEAAMRRKRLVAPLVGLTFHPFSSSYLALDEAHYDSFLYFGTPGVMPQFMQCHEFPAPHAPKVQHRRPEWLFLGQPTPEKSKSSYVAYLHRALELSAGRLVYKPHPAESLSSLSWLDELDVRQLTSYEAAEDLSLEYAAVAGIASSAMLNVRILGWAQNVYGVLDPRELSQLIGRSLVEADQVACAMRSAGVRAL
jgi:hypothetical protein